MENIKSKCLQTTKHIADKILLLRRANKLTQEEFAEAVGLDRRTIARAEDGVHRPSPETIERLAAEYSIPVSYFYDSTIYRPDVNKTALIYEINTRLNTMSKKNLNKIISFMNIIE